MSVGPALPLGVWELRFVGEEELSVVSKKNFSLSLSPYGEK
jgi:hypothetical protein